MKIDRDFPLLIFGNIVNELMIGTVNEEYSAGMHRVMARKVWLMQAGDVLVIPVEVPADFKSYVCNITGVAEEDLTIVTCPGPADQVMADRVREGGFMDELKSLYSERPNMQMLAFGYDVKTLQLAKDLGIDLFGYDGYPTQETQDTFYRINTKGGFRDAAASLGLSIIPGEHLENPEALFEKIGPFLEQHGKIIVKLNRSSNGYGHLVIEQSDITSDEQLRATVQQYIERYSDQPQQYVMEKYVNSKDLPSVEITVDREGSEELYICNQFCYNNSWAGMITPPIGLDEDIAAELDNIGKKFGAYVHAAGFRGICDVDACLTTDNELFVTESNFRRTGGTYLDFILRRLIDVDYYNNRSTYWLADTKLAEAGLVNTFDEATARLTEAGLAYDAATESGILLTCYTYPEDSKWRYLIIDKDPEKTREYETKLAELFRFEGAAVLT